MDGQTELPISLKLCILEHLPTATTRDFLQSPTTRQCIRDAQQVALERMEDEQHSIHDGCTMFNCPEFEDPIHLLLVNSETVSIKS